MSMDRSRASTNRASNNQAFVSELTENDVLMGRGSHSTEYEGNVRFRQIVRDRREEYMTCTRRRDKQRIAEEIVATVHHRGGRFLQRIDSMEEAVRLGVPPRTQAWRVIPSNSALFVKVKQLMRDLELGIEREHRAQREQSRRLIIQNATAAAEATAAAASAALLETDEAPGEDDRKPPPAVGESSEMNQADTASDQNDSSIHTIQATSEASQPTQGRSSEEDPSEALFGNQYFEEGLQPNTPSGSEQAQEDFPRQLLSLLQQLQDQNQQPQEQQEQQTSSEATSAQSGQGTGTDSNPPPSQNPALQVPNQPFHVNQPQQFGGNNVIQQGDQNQQNLLSLLSTLLGALAQSQNPAPAPLPPPLQPPPPPPTTATTDSSQGQGSSLTNQQLTAILNLVRASRELHANDAAPVSAEQQLATWLANELRNVDPNLLILFLQVNFRP